MDDSRFDHLTRILVDDVNRRTTIKRIFGTVAGGFFGLAGLAQARADDDSSDDSDDSSDDSDDDCPNHKKRCGDQCIYKDACCYRGRPGCPSGKVCDDGYCVPDEPDCPDHKKKCGDICIYKDDCCTDGDPGCPPGKVCESGTCVPDNGGGGGKCRCRRDCERRCKFRGRRSRKCDRHCRGKCRKQCPRG